MSGPQPTSREHDLRPRVAHRGGRVAAVVAAVAALILGCGAPKASPGPGTAPQQAVRPLAPLATQAVALLPTQYLRAGDSTYMGAGLGPAPQVLASLDSAIVAELAARGTARQWIMPDALTRSAKRNPAFTSDPHTLSAESLRQGVRRTNPRLGEPLASQMRSLVALTEARFGLIPVEVRFEPIPPTQLDPGAVRAILRVVLVDARTAEITWTADVATPVSAPPSRAAVVEGLARRVADLLVAP